MDLSDINQKIQNIKWKSEKFVLLEKEAKSNPFEQFIIWFSEVLQAGNYDPTAMMLATVDANDAPDARVVLLKELEENKFIFYTSYASNKAQQLAKNNLAALNFYWPTQGRQVRIRGRVEKVSREKSAAYFATRPREAQLNTHAWSQDAILVNREEMDDKLKQISEKFSNQKIPCPENWGGYAVIPFGYEFFQGRPFRMHDRLHYILQNGVWKMERLAP